MHARWRSETQGITITGADISSDLQKCRVFYSVLGDRESSAAAAKFFAKNSREIRRIVGSKIVLKFTPELRFCRDHSVERGMRVLEILDELDESGEAPIEGNGKKTEEERYREKEAWKARKAEKRAAKKSEPRRNDWKSLAEDDD